MSEVREVASLVAQCRAAYGKLETIDPTSPGYQRLCALLDRMTQEQLRALAEAEIKFVSKLARNRIRRPS